MAQKNTPGIKITQAGIDARYAADYQYSFNSDWPSLAIAFEVLVTVETTVTPIPPIPHGLKFTPFTIGWAILDGVSIGRVFGSSISFSGPQTDITLEFDDEYIYLSNDAVYNSSYEVLVRCYNIDITKSINYTLPETPTIKTTYDPLVGIKVSKYGKSSGSNDLRDFILHSRAQSPALLAVVTQDEAYVERPFGTFYNYKMLYVNPVNYVPWTYAFIGTKNGKYSPLAPGGAQAPPIFILTENVNNFLSSLAPITVSGPGAIINYIDLDGQTAASIVVLRDPLVVSSRREVTY